MMMMMMMMMMMKKKIQLFLTIVVSFLFLKLSELLKLKLSDKQCPRIVSAIFTDDILATYMQIFSHLLKFRYAAKLL